MSSATSSVHDRGNDDAPRGERCVGEEVRLVSHRRRLQPCERFLVVDRFAVRVAGMVVGEVCQHLVHFGDGPHQRDVGIEMRAETRNNALCSTAGFA